MAEPNKHLDQHIDDSERLGVVGSPSSTAEIALDILGHAVTRKLVGELAIFRFRQDSKDHYSLGQITEIQLKNIWHEDPTMRSLIRQRGHVDAVSERQDTHLGKMSISAVFQKRDTDRFEPSLLGTVPSTGTFVHLVTDAVLDQLMAPYKNQIYYLGNVYGSEPKLPLWFKHFDRGFDGAGEAYHLGVFGKTGSGKSVLAKMILLAYARYANMALLVVDPQGEFAQDLRDSGDKDLNLPFKRILDDQGKPSYAMTVQNLVLDRWDLFEEILKESNFFDRLTIRYATNKDPGCSVLVEALQKKGVKLKALYERKSFDVAWELLGDEGVQKKFLAAAATRERFNSALEEADAGDFYKEFWRPATQLFRADRDGVRTVEQALKWLLDPDADKRPMLVVDLSSHRTEGLLWNDRIQSLVIKRLLDGLTVAAEKYYKDGQSLNTLVAIDEAHRLAPRYLDKEEEAAKSVRSTLVDAVRTTRKFGLGWLFISQTLSSIHQEIIQQLRISFFGFGLGLGQEFQSLSQLVGGADKTSLDLYRSFRDPHSAMDISSRQYSFMTIGPVSPLSFAGSPLFFNAFNRMDRFLSSNGFAPNEEA